MSVVKKLPRKRVLKGSCHCQKVKFSFKSSEYYPYQLCYCSICRKTQGGGGFSINLGGDAGSLKTQGEKNIKIYHARMKKPGDGHAHPSSAERHFRGLCGSGLWLFSPEWPDLIHPFACAIDSALPVPPEHTHLMLKFKAGWVEPHFQPGDKKFQNYSKESLADWHKRIKK